MTRTVTRQSGRRRTRRGWDFATPVERTAADLAADVGLELPERPVGGVPHLPEDPTDLSDSQLMSLFRELTEWASYASSRLAVAEVEEKYAVGSLDRRKAISLLHGQGESEKTMTLAKARTQEDPEFVKAQEAYDEIYARRKILGTLNNTIEGRATLLSRELTRRVNRAPQDGRANWSGA